MTCSESLMALLKFIANFICYSLVGTYYLIKAILLFFVPKCLRFKDISGDIVLVTGGASGIGRLMAKQFAKRGATVVIWDLNLAGLEETTKMIEEMRSKKDKVGKCHHYQVDISDRFKVYAAAERVAREVGEVSILVNNAGIVTGKRFLELSDAQIQKTFDVNALAHFWLLKAFLPSMMERNHGHHVSVASIAGMVGAYQLTDYCASKFAACGLEESLRLELTCDGYDGIHSTVVCPYYIATGMFEGIGRSLIPILTPEYVANETVKAVLVDQEVLCVPMICYWIIALRSFLPTRTFLWYHRAMGAASTMKTFTGRRNGPHGTAGAAHQDGADGPQANTNLLGQQDVVIKMKPDAIGITIPPQSEPHTQQTLNQ